MPNALYLSFLGITNYTPVNYTTSTHRYTNLKFVQLASLQSAIDQGDIKSGDHVQIVCTPKSKETNWQPLKEKLERICESAQLVLKEPLIISESNATELELWQTFETISESIDAQVEVIADITQSFRTLPIMFIVLIQYLKVVKEINLTHLYYGSYESIIAEHTLNHPKEIENLPIDDRNAPLLNLAPFLTLFDWSLAIDRYNEAGDASLIQELSQDTFRPQLKATKGQDQSAKALKDVSMQLRILSDALFTPSGRVIQSLQVESHLLKRIDQIDVSKIPPLAPILDQLKERLSEWGDQDEWNIMRAVEWCIQRGLIQQAFTFLQEGTVDLACRIFSSVLAPIEKERDRRTFMSALLQHFHAPHQWNGILVDYRSIAEHIASQLPASMSRFRDATAPRNQINHAGFTSSNTSLKTLKKNVNLLYEDLLTALQELKACAQELSALPEEIPEERGKVFLNLSNHPLERWSEEQKSSALALGCEQLVEIKFPEVDPHMDDTLEYVAPVMEQLDALLNHLQMSCGAAMVLGEYSTTVHLVHALQNRGVPCYMATNHRLVEEVAGKKISRFQFIRFRKWPSV